VLGLTIPSILAVYLKSSLRRHLVNIWSKYFVFGYAGWDFAQFAGVCSFNLIYSWIFVMKCSNVKKFKKPQANLKQEIVNYFQIKFDEDTCIFPIVEE